jgi:hypothetical protein
VLFLRKKWSISWYWIRISIYMYFIQLKHRFPSLLPPPPAPVVLGGVKCNTTDTNPEVNGRAMAQVVSRRPLSAEDRVRARVNPCGICGGQSGTGTGFSPSSSVLPCRYIIPPSFSKLI